MALHSADLEDLLRQAKFALDSDRPQQAERIAEQILKTDPRRAQARYGWTAETPLSAGLARTFAAIAGDIGVAA